MTGAVLIATKRIQQRLTISAITKLLEKNFLSFVTNVVLTRLSLEKTPAKEALETSAKSETLEFVI